MSILPLSITSLQRSLKLGVSSLAMGICLVACAQTPASAPPAAQKAAPVLASSATVVAQASPTAPAAPAAPTVPLTPPAAIKPCPEKRSEICPSIHKPVCAQRDTGVRCVRAPCPSEASVTFENSCAACRDSKVLGYVEGACGAATPSM